MNYKIGIPGWMIGTNSFGVTAPYIAFIEHFGEPVILTPKSEFKEDLDLIILPGGPDVDTTRYNEAPWYYTGKPCPFREYFDKVMLPKYVENNTPIYGICRGMQSLGVFFGGKLIQHVNHETNPSTDRSKLVHGVILDNKFKNIIKNNISCNIDGYRTNSIHHQVVSRDSLYKTNMEIIGVSNVKGEKQHVELIAHNELPIVGEQAHPEETYNEFAIKTIEYLLKYKKSILL